MPELPEVETVVAALQRARLPGCRITGVTGRCAKLRRPLPFAALQELVGETITEVSRRAKYLLFRLENGSVLLLHLGMTGTLRLDKCDVPPQRHDHFDLELNNDRVLRFRDPRKFGLIAVYPAQTREIPELKELAPEPLSNAFDGDYLYHISRTRKVPIKNFIMDQRRVVGVGNIYASESLFRARIRPQQPAGRLNRKHCRRLVECIKEILDEAIAAGGTTISDFHGLDGSEGNFVRTLKVYGRENVPCPVCGHKIRKTVIGGRSTFYCPDCQK